MNDSVVAQCRIPGRARTKGSMKVITNARTRKPQMIEDHAHSKPWRDHIVREIRKQCWNDPSVRPEPYVGPVEIRATFLLPNRGDAANLLPYPTLNAGINANGDLDKFLRNVLDALVDASTLADDSQVVALWSAKLWAPPGSEELQLLVLKAPSLEDLPLKCPECGWMDWHAIGCPRDLGR